MSDKPDDGTPPDGAYGFARVARVLDRLLDPENGCPWDLKQTPDTIKLHLLEEMYELVSAIEDNVDKDVCEETGDCLFMLVFLTRLYRKRGAFNLDDVLNASANKMISRHPHIFANGKPLDSPEAVKKQWHELKQTQENRSLLGGVPRNLPALLRAHRLSERTGKCGFDWNSAKDVLASVHQEMDEFEKALDGEAKERAAEELGDVLFTLANLSRHLGIRAEDALRATNDRFVRRFEYIEKALFDQGRTVDQASLEEMDRLWDEAKKEGL
jgi:MazG family protein